MTTTLAATHLVTGYAFLLAAVCTEACGQAQLKRSTDKVRDGDPLAKAVRRVLKRWPRLAGAIALYVVEAVLYTLTLNRLPLSKAFPTMSLSFAVVTAISAVWLRERVSPRRWAGVLLILAGVTLVCL